MAGGGFYFDRTLAAKALIAQAPPVRTRKGRRRSELSDREKEVLILVAWGYSNKEIAEKIAVSSRTVETYRARIGKKLSLRTRADVVRYALREGWLGETSSENEPAGE